MYADSNVITSNRKKKKFECYETTVSRSRQATRAFITNKTKISGGTREGARGGKPPLFLDHTEARRAEKNFLVTEPPLFSGSG